MVLVMVLNFSRFWEIVIINAVFIFLMVILSIKKIVIFLRDVTIGIRAKVLKIFLKIFWV